MKHSLLGSLALLLVSAEVVADGRQTFEDVCGGCHRTGLLGSPKFGDKTAWGPRLEKGIDTLLETVKAGKVPMPPRGGCKECSDDDLRNAIEYMAEAAK